MLGLGGSEAYVRVKGHRRGVLRGTRAAMRMDREHDPFMLALTGGMNVGQSDLTRRTDIRLYSFLTHHLDKRRPSSDTEQRRLTSPPRRDAGHVQH